MKLPAPHVVVDVTLYTTEEGGRTSPTPPDQFGCICLKEPDRSGSNWDCRLVLNGKSLAPGESRRVGLLLLSGDEAARDLRAAGRFYLWDGRVIGEAVVALPG